MLDQRDKEWTVAPFSNFYGKLQVGFCLNIGKHFILQVSFYNHKEEHRFFLKNATRDLQNSPYFERLPCFYVRTSGNLERFRYFNFETNFLKNENLFEKTGVSFFILITKIENKKIPYKTALSEANVKTNRMGSTKRTYLKESSFATNLFFWKFYFIRTCFKELLLCTNHPNAHIHIFCKRWGFVWGCFFP